jgi:Ca2+-transporting ATPase
MAMAYENRHPDLQSPWRRDAGEVIDTLGSDAAAGLSTAEAGRRLAIHGPNRLTETTPVSAWRKFLEQFTDTLVLLLIAAAAISLLIWMIEGHGGLPYEAIAILSIVVLNAIMGFTQQSRAENALNALRVMSAPQATVIRDAERHRLAAADLVPGDIILVEEGDTIPADARLLQSASLKTAEASLTGESLPVFKTADALGPDTGVGDRVNMLYAGTSAVGGHGRGVVTATGMDTETGRIATMLEQTVDESTPLQQELDGTGRLLGLVVVAIAAVMIAIVLFVSEVDTLSEFFGILILGVALAVAAVPEGLPAIVTAVLSIGVQRMAGRNAIVRKLAAVETLGSTDVIASDKTGTLTRNEMTVRCILTASGRTDFEGTGYAPEGEIRRRGENGAALGIELERALRAARCANNASLRLQDGRWLAQGDPTEVALLTAAFKAADADAPAPPPRLWEIPFSSERKVMTTVHQEDGQVHAFTKGAPDVLLSHCAYELVGGEAVALTAERRAAIAARNNAMAAEALRTLAVATRRLEGGRHDTQLENAESDLVFIGLIGMIDPPREEARAAVAKASDAGIRVVMITGDHPVTASVIAGSLGIDGARVVTGTELSRMSEAELDSTAREVSVYARVDPAHKLAIVGALQRQGATVAMTGDGVNDAPALKAADIGIAMGITGTDVSKGAADIVLADDNFATIVAAVEEGRSIFASIRKFLRYLLSSNIGEVMTMFFGVLFAGVIGLSAADGSGIGLPLLATQILWINLATDGAPALALGIDPTSPGIMKRRPRPPHERVITATMWRGIFFVGAVMAAGTLLVIDASLPGGLVEGDGDIDHARTMGFTTLTLFQLFNVFNARSDERSAFDGLFSNRWLWWAVLLSLGLHVAVVYVPVLQNAFSTVPLQGRDWLICMAVASSVLWLREIWKWTARAALSRPARNDGVLTG